MYEIPYRENRRCNVVNAFFVTLFHFVMLIFAHFSVCFSSYFIVLTVTLSIFFCWHRVSNVVRVRILIEFFISLNESKSWICERNEAQKVS